MGLVPSLEGVGVVSQLHHNLEVHDVLVLSPLLVVDCLLVS